MKKELHNSILIIVFILMITLPQISFWVFQDEITIENTENRTLATKPKFKFSTIEEYPSRYNKYYNDHIPYRGILKNIWSNLNYDIFKTTVDDIVVLGKENWLFNTRNYSFEQTQGTLQFSEDELERGTNILKANDEKLKNKGIEYYILILPEKENLYREYLPDNIKFKEKETRTEKLVEYVKNNSDLNIIYPKEELEKGKESYQVYRTYDTHWNAIGAIIGVIELQKAIDSTFDMTLEELEPEAIGTEKGGLSNIANLNNKFQDIDYQINGFYEEIKCEIKETNDTYVEYESNSENDKTVVVIGDSFREEMRPYFSKLYKRVIWVHRDDYKKSMIEQFNPDIVVHESVERVSNKLFKNLL